jgi:hypothetical protein
MFRSSPQFESPKADVFERWLLGHHDASICNPPQSRHGEHDLRLKILQGRRNTFCVSSRTFAIEYLVDHIRLDTAGARA